MPSNTPLTSLAKRAQDLADALRSMDEARDESDWMKPHPATQRLLTQRGVTREQLNYSVPVDLELKQRINAFNVTQGGPGAGNIVAAALDMYLRAHGFPPGSERVD